MKKFYHDTAKARTYSSNYYQIPVTGDVSSLVVLSYEKIMYVMKSFSIFKFLKSIINRKKIVENYQLRWSDGGKEGG